MSDYLIIGGDLRYSRLAEYLAEKDGNIYAVGINAEPSANIHLSFPDYPVNNIILPLPVSNDGININAPCSAERLPLNQVTKYLSPNGVVFGGRFSSDVLDIFSGHQIIDYSQREEFAVTNALATAEGTLQIIMEETAFTVSGQKILILGMGRISKALIRILSGFNAQITAAARKYSDLAWAEIYGCQPLNINQIDHYLHEYAIIINTVPSKILDKTRLEKIQQGCLIIDLASKPGGIDFDAAAFLNLRVLWCLSLPGKVAPLTAGETIGKTIENILHERGDIL